MRRPGPPARSASTDQIMELRNQGLTRNEVARQVGRTVSGAWSRYRKARPPKPPRLGRWQKVLADALEQTLRSAYGQPWVIISAEPPPKLSPPRATNRPSGRLHKGWTLHQIGVELGLSATTVSHQLRRAGVTMSRDSSRTSCLDPADPGAA
jgi:hypothetical protein